MKAKFHLSILFCAFVLIFGLLVGCGVSDPVPVSIPSVQSHFYPFSSGAVYTYSRFDQNRYDTLVCTMHVAQTSIEINRLVYQQNNIQKTLYGLSFSRDVHGGLAAVLANDTSTFYALDGTLDSNSSWLADSVHGITATLIAQYDEYFPRHDLKYTDVVLVKYHQIGQPEDNYTLRFFARNIGLVSEREIVGPNTEIGNLQLLGVAGN